MTRALLYMTKGARFDRGHLPNYNLGGRATPYRHRLSLIEYGNDEGQLVAIGYDDWKCVFFEQTTRALGVWQGGLTDLCVPKLFNLRTNPFERGDQSILYDKWLAGHVFV
jgi:hypothetical protein